jgi:repressor of nif and glnA expression
MSVDRKRTETVYAIILELVEGGLQQLRPGNVNSALRERGQPMGTWEVRGEFSILQAQGLIDLDTATGDWHVTENATRKTQSVSG